MGVTEVAWTDLRQPIYSTKIAELQTLDEPCTNIGPEKQNTDE